MPAQSFPLGDKYKLQFDVNAVCEAEEVFKEPLEDVLNDVKKMKQARIIRVLLWAALQEHHPELSLRDTGKIIGEMGAEPIEKAIIGSLHAAYPDRVNADGSPKKK